MNRTFKHVNKDLLLDIFGDDIEIILDMVDVFVNMATSYYKDILEDYENKKWFELGLVAHKAKGSCRTMGLQNIGESLHKIENNAKGIAYNELDENRNLSHDQEKLYQTMLKEGQKEGDTNIIDKEILYLKNNFEEAVQELVSLKESLNK